MELQKDSCMKGMELLQAKRQDLLRLAKKYGVNNIRVFGSVARGEDHPDSDVDLLVTLEEKRDLFDLGGFQCTASEALGRHVDVVMDHHIHPKLRDAILKDAMAL